MKCAWPISSGWVESSRFGLVLVAMSGNNVGEMRVYRGSFTQWTRICFAKDVNSFKRRTKVGQTNSLLLRVSLKPLMYSKYNTANIRPWFFSVGEWEVLHQVGKGLAGWGSPRRSRSAFRYLSQNMLEDVANRLKCALLPWQKKRWKVWPFHRILDQVPGSFILPCHPDWKFIIFSYTIVLTLRSISHLTLFKQIPMYPHTYIVSTHDIRYYLWIGSFDLLSAILHCCYPPLIVLFHKSIFHFHNKEPQQKERSKVAPVNPIEGSCLPYLLYGSPEIWKALWVSCWWWWCVVVGLDVQRRRSVIKFDCELKANDS